MTPFRSSGAKTVFVTWVAISIAIVGIVTTPSGWWLIGSFIAFQVYWIVGLSACSHRYYTHRSFETNRFWQEVMLALNAISVAGHPGLYALVHLKHHQASDTPEDPHLFYAAQSVLSPRDPTFSITTSQKKRYLLDPTMRRMLDYYYLYPLVAVAALACMDPVAVIYLWAIPVVVMTFSRKWVTLIWIHGFGYRTFDTKDTSTNSKLLGLLFGGEGLHNNHHAYPGEWNCAMSPGEIDPTAWFIRLIRKK